MAYTPATTIQAVEALYIGYFGRAGEPGGVQYWVNQINNGQTFAQAAAAFSVQAEAKAQHPFLANPSLVSPADFVESLYQQLFGRASDAAGKAYWVAQLQAANGNPFSYGLLVAQFISGAQNTADGQDIDVIKNKVAAAEYFTGKLASAGIQGVDDKGQVTSDIKAAGKDVVSGVTKDASTVTAANTKSDAYAKGGAVVGQTFTLKTDAGENIVGTDNNDTFNAIITNGSATLNDFDSIDGKGGLADTLVIISDANGASTFNANATIKNVEVFNFKFTANGANNIDAAKYAGVTNIIQEGNATTISGVTDAQTVTYKNTLVEAADTITTTKATANVALDNATSGSSLYLREATAGTLKTVNVNGSLASADNALTIDVATNPTSVSTLNVGLSSKTTVTLIADNDKLATIDLSKSTGAITLNSSAVTALKAVTGGTGADTLTNVNYNHTETTFKLDSGAGNDIIFYNVGKAAIATAATLTGGAGTDNFNLVKDANVGNLFAVATNADLTASLVTVTDFTAASDIINLTGFGTRATQNAVTAAASGKADLLAATTAVAGVVTDGNYGLFEFGGNTYIYGEHGAGGEGLGAGDTLIQLTGVTVASITAANFVG